MPPRFPLRFREQRLYTSIHIAPIQSLTADFSDHRQGHPLRRSLEVHEFEPNLGSAIKDLPLVVSQLLRIELDDGAVMQDLVVRGLRFPRREGSHETVALRVDEVLAVLCEVRKVEPPDAKSGVVVAE